MTDFPKQSTRSLDRQFVGGVAWTASGKWATQGITWVGVILIARILSPGELGLAAMAGIFHVLTSVLAEFGLGSAVVQMRDLSDEVIAQLQSAAVIICSVSFVIVLLLSPLVADFFGNPAVRWLVIGNGTAIIVIGFQAIPMALLRRALDYRRLAMLEVVEQIVRSVVSVVAALLGASYWSVVIGGISARVTVTAIVRWWAPMTFRMPHWEQIKAPLTFGMHVSTANFTSMLAGQLDPLFVARRLGENALGLYRIAIDMGNAPREKITSLLMRVSGPLFASIQKDPDLMKRYVLKLAEPLSLAMFPTAAGFWLVIPDLIPLLLGPQWQSAIAPMRILTISAGLAAVSALNSQVLTSLHETRFLMKLSIVKFSILPFAFYFASNYGLEMVATVWLLTIPIELSVTTFRLLERLQLPFWTYARAILPGAIGSAIMVGVVSVLNVSGLIDGRVAAVRLGAIILLGVVTYLAALRFGYRRLLYTYVEFLSRLISERFGKAKIGMK